jgi:chromosomal replication initiator protein
MPYCKITDKNLTDDDKVKDIKEIVCKYFGISLWMIESRSRKREIVEPRQIATALVREFTRFSLKGTGLRFGGLDHSSIISAVNTVNDLIVTDKDYRKKFEHIKMLVHAKLGR